MVYWEFCARSTTTEVDRAGSQAANLACDLSRREIAMCAAAEQIGRNSPRLVSYRTSVTGGVESGLRRVTASESIFRQHFTV
ncbi:MAG: hypothetical protein QOI26_708 [Pseudonocardiales bacterium]|nr:hypothetical protein [Pseudonocardiales bacterium]